MKYMFGEGDGCARRDFIAALAAPLLASVARPSFADSRFPSRAVTFIVPFPAGATLDVLVRQVAQQLGELWKQPAIVENRTGAGGIVGISAGAKAPADGYTLIAVANSFVANTVLRHDLPYDAFADFVPVTLLGSVPHVLVANAASPYKTVAQLQQYAKRRGARLSYSSGGAGTMSHLAGEMLKRAAGIDAVHVPYRGQGPALADVVSGQVQLTFANLPEALPLIQQGKIVALAVAQPSRSQLLPDVPAFAELGMPSVVSDSWYGLVAPKGTPPDIAAQIQRDIARVLEEPTTRNRLVATGLEPAANTPKAFEHFMRTTAQAYRRVITDAHITAEK
jgi:tripartite-type tricarboxylate transporter receptor subunit TctC